MNNQEKAARLMAKGVDPREVGNPQVRNIMRNQMRENYKLQVAQATALNPSGLPQNLPTQPVAPREFNPTGLPQPRQTNYTVKDGDNLNTIAQQFSMNPNQVLDNNPQVQNLQTGMVINVNPPIPEGYQMNPWGNYTPNWIDRTLGTNTTPRGNPTPLHNADWMQDFYTWLGLYTDLSGRQWYERKP